MAKVRWSKDAIENLKDIKHFISEDSLTYASIFIERIFELVEHLEVFPEIGRKVPETNNPGVREIIYKNYRIVYQLKDDYLEIIAVFHGSRLYSPDGDD